MFDIAFSELLVIGVVALIVIGPERLPKLARTAGTWLGRLNRYVAQVKQDIDRDMQLEELRKLQQQMKDTAQKYEVIAAETGQELKREVEQVDRVMQAMAVTDGGLSLQEYEKVKTEKNASPPPEQIGEPAALPAQADAPQAKDDNVEAVDDPAARQLVQASADEPFRSSLEDELPTDDLAAVRPVETQANPVQNT